MATSTVEKAAYHTVAIDGTSINFPFQPYDLQVDYMRKVLECVREGRKGGSQQHLVIPYKYCSCRFCQTVRFGSRFAADENYATKQCCGSKYIEFGSRSRILA